MNQRFFKVNIKIDRYLLKENSFFSKFYILGCQDHIISLMSHDFEKEFVKTCPLDLLFLGESSQSDEVRIVFNLTRLVFEWFRYDGVGFIYEHTHSSNFCEVYRVYPFEYYYALWRCTLESN